MLCVHGIHSFLNSVQIHFSSHETKQSYYLLVFDISPALLLAYYFTLGNAKIWIFFNCHIARAAKIHSFYWNFTADYFWMWYQYVKTQPWQQLLIKTVFVSIRLWKHWLLSRTALFSYPFQQNYLQFRVCKLKPDGIKNCVNFGKRRCKIDPDHDTVITFNVRQYVFATVSLRNVMVMSSFVSTWRQLVIWNQPSSDLGSFWQLLQPRERFVRERRKGIKDESTIYSHF